MYAAKRLSIMRNITENSTANPQTNSTTDFNLESEHLGEFRQSLISDEIIDLNFSSLIEYEPLEKLVYALPNSERRNDGRLRSRWLRRYDHCYQGGWWFAGIDLLTFERSEWGCLKPDHPRYDLSRKRKIKYEHPPKTDTRVFAPAIGKEAAHLICDRWGFERYQPTTISDFWQYALENTKLPLFVTEGAKKVSSLCSNGYLCLASPGIWNAVRKRGDLHSLIRELEKFGRNREIFFVFDQDTKPETVKNVRHAIRCTGHLLERIGATVKVVQWDNKYKGVDDLIFNCGVEALDKAIENAVPLADFRLQSLTDLEPMVDEFLDRRYLGQLNIPQTAQIIGLQSAKGTGKTETLSQIVRDANYNGTPVLVITHRIQLAKALCARFGVDHLEEIKTSPTGGVLGYGLCIDSLHPFSKARFRPEQWDEAIVIIDECEQVFWHMLNSSTCKNNRTKILKTLKHTLQNVILTGGKVYLSDADLSPMAINYVKSLAQTYNQMDIETYIVKNRYNPNQGQRKLHLCDSQDHLLELVSAKLEADKKVYIACGAQKNRSTWGTQNLERLLSIRYPSKKIIRIDRQSLKDPQHPAYKCIEHINQTVVEYDIVVCSPTLETGVSIDVRGYFDAVFALASGVQTVDAVIQSVERVRDDIDRYLYAPNRGLSFVGGRETSPKALLKTQDRIAQTNINCLIAADLDGLDFDFDNLDREFQQESLLYWARRACVVNGGMYRYKASIVDKLLKEGYQLQQTDEKTDMATDIKQEIKAIKTEAYEQERREVAEKESIDDQKFKHLQEKYAKSEEEEQIERKAVLERRYGVEVTPELVEKDDKGWYGKLQLHYFFTLGRIYLEARDAKKLKGLGDLDSKGTEEEQSLSLFVPDANRDLLTLKIKTLEALNIKQFFDESRTFCRSDLQEWFEFVVSHRRDIKAILGVWISEDSKPMAAAQLLLKKMGLRLTYKGRFGARGERQTYYSCVIENPDGRQEVFEQWLERDRQAYGELTLCQKVS